MISIEFPEVNRVFAKDVEGHPPVHAYMDLSPKGNKDIVACYQMGFWERLMIMVTGKVWINVTTKNGTLLPMRLTVVKQHLITSRKQRKSMDKAKKKLNIPGPGEKIDGLKKV